MEEACDGARPEDDDEDGPGLELAGGWLTDDDDDDDDDEGASGWVERGRFSEMSMVRSALSTRSC